MTTEQEKMRNLIGKLPSWGNGDFTEQEWMAYLQCANYIQRFEKQDVIQLLEIIEHKYTSQPDSDKIQSKLFILLRILFDIPLSGNVTSRKSFKGWENWPAENESGEVNLSWPVTWKNNQPHLESNYEGSLGKSYASVKEYTYFQKLYIYRNIADKLHSD